jgi:hypothetical protein
MRFRFEAFLLLFAGLHCIWCEAADITPEQIEKNRPDEEITVTFKVSNVGVLIGGISQGAPPYLLEPDTKFQDKRSRLQVFLVGKAVKNLDHLDISAKYFQGKTISVTGKVQYETYPRDGKAADSYQNYSVVIDDLDNIRVKSQP